MPENKEKLSLDDLELTTEEAEQVKGGATLLSPITKLPLLAGPRPDQTLVFGPRPDQTILDALSRVSLSSLFTR